MRELLRSKTLTCVSNSCQHRASCANHQNASEAQQHEGYSPHFKITCEGVFCDGQVCHVTGAIRMHQGRVVNTNEIDGG